MQITTRHYPQLLLPCPSNYFQEEISDTYEEPVGESTTGLLATIINPQHFYEAWPAMVPAIFYPFKKTLS